MIKNIGELRHQIQIVRAFTGKDVPICTVWAAVEDASSREFYSAAASQFSDVVNFTIRWREGLAPGMVVLYAGKRHEIVHVNRLDHSFAFMQLKTARKAAASG